jgi:hypothetical protein
MPAPTTTLQEILDRARTIYLNDANGRVWLNEKLIPFFKTAYDELQTEYNNNDLQTIDAIADPLTITTSTIVYSPLPADFVWPVKLEERAAGSNDIYTPMSQLRWNVNIAPGSMLVWWSFYGDAITFPEHTTDREVLLYYKQLYPDLPEGSGDPIVDNTTSIYGHALSATAARIAGLIHRYVNQNQAMAEQCDATWEKEKFSVINMYTKKKQAIPARPRPFRAIGLWPWRT